MKCKRCGSSHTVERNNGDVFCTCCKAYVNGVHKNKLIIKSEVKNEQKN